MRRSKVPVLPMTGSEQRAAAGLAGIYALRMLGLFLILPVFAVEAQTLAGATPLLIGFAIGAYGLTQALLQIPFGLLSDRIGRRQLLIAGYLVACVGILVLIPTAMPLEPFTSRLGMLDGRTAGSSRLPSKLSS